MQRFDSSSLKVKSLFMKSIMCLKSLVYQPTDTIINKFLFIQNFTDLKNTPLDQYEFGRASTFDFEDKTSPLRTAR